MKWLVYIWVWVCCLSVVLLAADSTRVSPPEIMPKADSTRAVSVDSTTKADSVAAPAPLLKAPKPFKKLTPHFDSLLTLLFGSQGDAAVDFDLPQASSRFDYDPLLFPLSSSQWGEFESVYPSGLSPSALSRVDPLTGDESFANPVPLPGSEEYTRMEPAEGYHLLSPTLAGMGSPFGRPFVVYQQSQLPDDDNSQSEIFVTHGTGGFANTAFTFKNHFGAAGIVNADGTFIRKNRDYSYSGSKLNRLRLISRPVVARNLATTIGLSLNRMIGDKLFHPRTAFYSGDLSDNNSAISTQIAYYKSEKVNYRASLVYRNDDQRITYGGLQSHQRFQIADLHLARQTEGTPNDFELGGDLRYLRYTENHKVHNTLYHNISASDLLTLTDRINAYGNFSLRGSNDLRIKPAATLCMEYRIDSLRSVATIASRGVFMPQPEMLYLRPISGALFDSSADYRVSGNEQLESGYSNSVEILLRGSFCRHVSAQARAGYANFHSLPQWQVDYETYANGNYRAVTVDRNLFFAALTARLTLPKGFYGQASYAFRNVYHDGINLTEGPQHQASGYAGVRFPVRKLKIMLNAAVGGRFRSASAQYFGGGSDDARMLAEAYFSFDLKSFHFFYNYTNLLNANYYFGGYLRPGRAIWWGFNWAFID